MTAQVRRLFLAIAAMLAACSTVASDLSGENLEVEGSLALDWQMLLATSTQSFSAYYDPFAFSSGSVKSQENPLHVGIDLNELPAQALSLYLNGRVRTPDWSGRHVSLRLDGTLMPHAVPVSANLGFSAPTDDPLSGTVVYRFKRWQARYTLSYEPLAGVEDLSSGLASEVNLEDELFHRIYLAYFLGKSGQVDVYGGVDNLTDRLGPGSAETVGSGARELLEDVDGRTFFVGARMRF